MKAQLEKVFGEVDSKIAKTVSQVMALIMLRGGFNIWPNLLQFLTGNLLKECFGTDLATNAQNLEIVENSIHTIAIIVEDCSKQFEDEKFRSVVTDMFPPICKLISTNYNEAIVQNAINTINMLLLTNTDIILQSMDEYLGVLLSIGLQIDQGGKNSKVKWRVVQGITTIMEIQMTSVISQFQRVQDLMYGALMHKDQQVALAASEFWSGINNTKLDENDEIRVSKIENSMEQILPALLECCVMQNVDRMGDMPSKESDIAHVEAKGNEDEDDDDDGESE